MLLIDTCMCIKTLGSKMHTNVREVVNLVEEDCAMESDVPETFYILFFQKRESFDANRQNGIICLISVVNP